MKKTNTNIKSLAFIGVVGCFLFLCAIPNIHSLDAQVLEPGFEIEQIVDSLVWATAMDFAPDGRIFIATKGGDVRVVKNGALLAEPLISLSDINTFGDRGLLGLAVDPDFSENGYVYLSYTFENSPGVNFGGPKTGRIVRVTVVGDTASESSKLVLVGTEGGSAVSPSCEDFPVTADCIPSDSNSHSMGALRFGPDGKLYATTGDGSDFVDVDPRAFRSQDIDRLSGKVLRINTDGTAPADNPFFDGDPNSNRSKVYAYGFRNMFRINFHPVSGLLFGGDVGWSDWEEVNRIEAGGNYGWPCVEGVSATAYNCEPSSTSTPPLYYYPHNEAGAGSITVGAFGGNGVYPSTYDDTLFIGDYAQNWIKLLHLDSAGNFVGVSEFLADTTWPVDLTEGIDGNVYYIDIALGSLNRITHTSGNRRPVVSVNADPTSGLTPLDVSFSSLGTYDPDGDTISYEWNFGDGGVSSEANPEHTYVNQGSFDAFLTVTDSHGSQSSESATIVAGDQAPVGVIIEPSSGSLYSPLETFHISGVGTDAEDGDLPASAYHWDVILHHNTHVHLVQVFDGVTSASFIADDHNASDVYMEVVLTVTDSAGLQSITSINLYLDNGLGSGNLISNPSVEFEDGLGNPIDWFQGWYGSLNPTFTYPVSGFDGSDALKLNIQNRVSGNGKWYFSPVFVSPGETYTFRDTYTATVDTEVVAQLKRQDGTYQYQWLGTLPAASTPTLNEMSITIPAGIETMTVFHELTQDGELITDDFFLGLANNSDEIPPTVSITSPLDGAIVNGTVLVAVDASDNVGVSTVHLVIDDVETLIHDTEAPFVLSWDSTSVVDGQHTISAHAHDNADNSAEAIPITVTVDNTGQENLILNGDLEVGSTGSPAYWTPVSWGNHTTLFSYPEIGIDGGKAAKLEITEYPVDGTGDARWQFTDVEVMPGEEYTYNEYYISNTISDVIGRYTRTDGSYHYFGLTKELQPQTDWTFNTGTFTIPENVEKVTLLHLISWIGTLSIDQAELLLVGTSTPSETEPPVVTFTNLSDGDTISGLINISADATDNVAVDNVWFAVDGIQIGPTMTAEPYSYSWDSSTVANGQHLLKATVTDTSGNNSTETISVMVENTTPPSETILNGSFEDEDVHGDPLHWIKGGWGANTRNYVYPISGPTSPKAARVEISEYTSGDAKWFFEDVPVTGGQTYTLTHTYRSNISSNITVRYTMADQSYEYIGLANPVATESWSNVTTLITVPADAVSMTVMHIIFSAGYLEVDDFVLSMGNTNSFDRGKVSFSFDDGWISQYTDAVPALNARGIDGTFYIVTQDTLNADPEELIYNASLEYAGPDGDPDGWKRGGWGTNDRSFEYPALGHDGGSATKVSISNITDGDAKWYFNDIPVFPLAEYNISDKYNATTDSDVVVRFTLNDQSTVYQFIKHLAPTNGLWEDFSATVAIPANTASMTVFHVLGTVGELSIDDFSVKVVKLFVNPSEVLDIASAGHEIGSHTKTHAHLTEISTEELTDEVADVLVDFANIGITSISSFAYPYGEYNDEVINELVSTGYTGARSVDRGYNDIGSDPMTLKIQQMDRTTTISDVQGWIDQAAQDKTWLILMFHQINDNPQYDLGVTRDLLEQTADYAVSADVDIVTIAEGLSLLE